VGEDALFADLPRQDGAIAGFARALGRERLDTLLLERAARLGVAILQPCAVKDVERRGSRYACRLAVEQREAERIEAPVLIAAHGSWEPQPWHERAAKRTRPSDLVAFKANFSGTNLEPGLLPVLAFRGGYGGMVVADGGMLPPPRRVARVARGRTVAIRRRRRPSRACRVLPRRASRARRRTARRRLA